MVGEQRHLTAQHRDIDGGAFSALLAPIQRCCDRVGREHARGNVGNRGTGLRWPAPFLAGDAHHSAHALHDQIVGCAVRRRPLLAESGNGCEDQARIARVHRVIAKAKPRDGAGREVLHQHIGRIDQPPKRFLAKIRLEIERNRALVAIDRQEVTGFAIDEWRTPGARIVPCAGHLHLDHIGAHIAQHHGAIWTGHDAGQIDDADSVQGELRCSFSHADEFLPFGEQRVPDGSRV